MRARTPVALVLTLVACGGGKPSAAPARAVETHARAPWSGSLSPRPSPDAVAVAEVNGDTIWDVDVARHAGARHKEPRAALDELIELQLLAQEAVRRGLADDPQVAEARKQARARALVHGDFAATFKSPDDVPQADIDLVWSNPKVYLRFNHQLYHEVRFVRLDLRKESTPAEIEELRQKAEQIHDAVVAAHPATKEAFAEVATAAGRDLGVSVSTQDHAATDRGTVKEFLAAAMALTTPGDISPVTRTAWGWDVLYLYNVIPEIKQTKEQATPELRKAVFDESRRRAFLVWADQLVRAAKVVRHDELLQDDATQEATPAPPP